MKRIIFILLIGLLYAEVSYAGLNFDGVNDRVALGDPRDDRAAYLRGVGVGVVRH